MATKQIAVEQLLPGMYVVALDRPWLEAQLLRKHRIESEVDIATLQAHGVRRVTIDPTLGKDVAEGSSGHATASRSDPLAADLARAHAVRHEVMTAVQGIFEGVRTGARIDAVATRQAVTTLLRAILHGYEAMVSLIHMRRFDAGLFAHAVNVCTFALIFGKQQGFRKAQLECLGIGALLHDVGKMRLPRNLLHKRGPYSEQEQRLLRQHPQLGAAIVSHSKDLPEDVQRIILEHHERYDGSGYPLRLKGEQLSPLSEIVALVNVYDNFLSEGPERPPLPPTQALKQLYLLGQRGAFDLRWVERLICCFGVYPVGSVVELDSGERGIVVAHNPADALRPTVKLLWDAQHQPYAVPRLLDLTAPDGPQRQIVRVLDPVDDGLDLGPFLQEAAVQPVG